MPTAMPTPKPASSASKTPQKAAAPKVAAKSPARNIAVAKTAAPRKSAAPKSPLRPAAKAAVQPVKVVKAAKILEASKVKPPKKPKLVRDSFTMPIADYALIDALKQRALKAAHPAKKSELLRAGLQLLASLSDIAMLKALKNVPPLKTGRPKGK